MIRCDVLVVGGGGAALRAAIAAKEYNPALSVLLVTKGKLGKSGVTASSCSDRMAFHATLEHTKPGGIDAWKYHADDIYRIGGKVSDYDLAEILAKNAKEAFYYLDSLGVPFVKRDGLAHQFVTDGSDYARACYTGPTTAVDIENALVKRFLQLDIAVREFFMIAQLILQQGRVVGAVAVDTREKDPSKAAFSISAGAVILATGGGGLMYQNNVFPGGMTGDGFALAYRAGAELVNMEFIQIGIASTATKLNCSGSFMRAVPRLVNDQGEEFLSKYFPENTSLAEIHNTVFKKGASWPVSYEHKTHIIDIALYKERQAGHKVYLDYSINPKEFTFDMLTVENRQRYYSEMGCDLGEEREQSPLIRLQEINQASIDWFKDRGIDLLQGDKVEVAACAQHFQGGVKIDPFARTTLPGLWAAGETAGGQHGANRPGGNALLDCQVFGKIAGEDAAKEVLRNPLLQVSRLDENDWEKIIADFISSGEGEKSVTGLRGKIQNIMERSASIVRTRERLQQGLNELGRLSASTYRPDERGLAAYWEDRNMLLTGFIVATAALTRVESRGPHMRFDADDTNIPVDSKNDLWEKYIVISSALTGLKIEVRTPCGAE